MCTGVRARERSELKPIATALQSAINILRESQTRIVELAENYYDAGKKIRAEGSQSIPRPNSFGPQYEHELRHTRKRGVKLTDLVPTFHCKKNVLFSRRANLRFLAMCSTAAACVSFLRSVLVSARVSLVSCCPRKITQPLLTYVPCASAKISLRRKFLNKLLILSDVILPGANASGRLGPQIRI